MHGVCLIDGAEVDFLIDTEAEVSAVSESFMIRTRSALE
jgi:hypothetical protein